MKNVYSLPIFLKIKLWGVDWGVNTKNYLKFIEFYKDLQKLKMPESQHFQTFKMVEVTTRLWLYIIVVSAIIIFTRW